MNKWIAIPVIAVLAVGIIVGGYFLWQQTSKLGEAESEIVTLEGNVATLEGNVATLETDLADSEATVSTLETDLADSEATVSTLEGNVATLETDLADSEATVSTLEADLGTANSQITSLQADVSTQQTINSSLSAELKKVKDPRHFVSLSELVDWLRDDDTDTKYADESLAEKALILQVRALRDGYLLLAFTYEEGGGFNYAIIDDELWFVFPEDDETSFYIYVDPLPSHPLPLD
ncbi:hypothetical protein ES703_45830 [subsurface metagenome]